MKYTRLTKEQLEELHKEFINFLATQSITADEWEEIKRSKPEVAEEELDIFSDLVWEGVLQKANYLENISPSQLFLFYLDEKEMNLIGVKVTREDIDITTRVGYQWLQENYHTEAVEFVTGSKSFGEDRQKEIFDLIQQGAVITKGELYQFFEKLIS